MKLLSRKLTKRAPSLFPLCQLTRVRMCRWEDPESIVRYACSQGSISTLYFPVWPPSIPQFCLMEPSEVALGEHLYQSRWDATDSVPTHPGGGDIEAGSIRSCNKGRCLQLCVTWPVSPTVIQGYKSSWTGIPGESRLLDTQGHTVRGSRTPASQGWRAVLDFSFPSQSALQARMAMAAARYVTVWTTPPATTSLGPVTAAQGGRGHGVIKVRMLAHNNQLRILTATCHLALRVFTCVLCRSPPQDSARHSWLFI